MRRVLLFVLFIASTTFAHAASYPKEVEAALKKAGKNRTELEKAIRHFQLSHDQLKLKAVYFLIANMDIHYSMNYYWADAKGKKVSFNELAYPDFNTAVKAFGIIKAKTPGIHPVPVKYRDIDSIKADFLINNIDRAFEVWKRPAARQLSFANFCEYILPYRASVEPLQNWRDTYMKRFDGLYQSIKNKSVNEALHTIVLEQKKWFTNTWEIEHRSEPLPRLGAMQLLLRKKGNCDDMAGLQVFILRSQGYPATIDNIPFWATTSGTHFFNVTFDKSFRPVPFDVATAGVKIDTFEREPSKVVRTTFSKQPDALVNFISKNDIPEGFMQTSNYKDVTKEYWQTKDIAEAVSGNMLNKKIAYACVFNYLSWKPTWWGKVKKDSVRFNNMCRGVVYMPMWYVNHQLQPAGYPIAVGIQHQLVLKPDISHLRIINIKQEDKYLNFQPGKNYKLFYWDNKWKMIGQQRALNNVNKMMFVNVPRNALLLLLPEYSQKKERPFIITDNNERVWF